MRCFSSGPSLYRFCICLKLHEKMFKHWEKLIFCDNSGQFLFSNQYVWFSDPSCSSLHKIPLHLDTLLWKKPIKLICSSIFLVTLYIILALANKGLNSRWVEPEMIILRISPLSDIIQSLELKKHEQISLSHTLTSIFETLSTFNIMHKL